MTKDRDNAFDELRGIVGRRHMIASRWGTLRYRRGYRSPPGQALAVVRPATLVQFWQILELCVEHGFAILIQAANTGLTGGSNPDERTDRPLVIINTLRLSGIHLLDGGSQTISLPGTTLYQLEAALRAVGREPHSVIGSSCFGATIVGGVCNNSGGSLIQRGPAYTELALYARVTGDGRLDLVNRLGVDLGDDPESMLLRLESGAFEAVGVDGAASDNDYCHHVRDVRAETPARFNADPRRLHDASGSAGHIAVFAVRLDSFPASPETTTYYLGTNRPAALTTLRYALLSGDNPLPISAEYLHRETFDLANRNGRDMFWAIRWLGTDRLPLLFALKARVDMLGDLIGINALSEHIQHFAGRCLPAHLPRRLLEYRDRFEHHLILKIPAGDASKVAPLLDQLLDRGDSDWFEADQSEAAKATLHRFVAAGAAIRYRVVERAAGELIALDVALRRNATDWFGELPADLEGLVIKTVRYGHFFCHVFHRDYILAPGADPVAVKARLLEVLDTERAEYPAEHNVGRQYKAKPELEAFYRQLDPRNIFNPGLGGTSAKPNWL